MLYKMIPKIIIIDSVLSIFAIPSRIAIIKNNFVLSSFVIIKYITIKINKAGRC